jgi:uncharacterized membrane protein YqgA involved in biofilm formation
LGTLINVVTILLGGVLGTMLGNRMPERMRKTVVSGLGLFTLAYGFKLFLETQNALIVAGGLLLGTLVGEWWQVEAGLEWLGSWMQRKVQRGNDGDGRKRFIQGFMTASLIFCIGPMAILGSIQDGLTGDYQTLAIKAILDGFAALAFASSLGIGVTFSAFPVLVYQGGITLLSSQVNRIATPGMMKEMSAVGGLLLIGLAISNLLEIKPIKVGNMLPALIIAPILAALVALF